MSKFVVSLFIAVAVALPMFPAAADKSGLNGKALRQAIAGRTVRLATPIGALPIRYLRNGTMSGAGSTLLAKYMGSNKDTGRWWIAGNRLCQKWSKWMDGRSYCYTMRKLGPTKVRWSRNDGRSGVATISH